MDARSGETEQQSREWYRVANLKPRLRSHARIHRHVYRGEPWFVVQDPTSGRFNRFTPLANDCIGLMNGERTLTEIWQLLDGRVTQDQLIELLSRLHLADLLHAGAPTDADELIERAEGLQRRQRWNRWRTPLAIRLPLWDPNRFLDVLLPVARLVFSTAGKMVWLMLVGTALLLAALNWAPLTENMADRVLGVENLLLLSLVFPVVKALHELGHGLAVKVRGGEVHEMGIMLLVLVPVPYVEASAATSFADKRDRMLVGAAGMLVEIAVAAVAIIVWVLVEPGAVRSVCFNTIVVAGISTLVFNGNPLLRFDSYYILMDAIEIPNFGSRANRYLFYLLHRYVFGVTSARSPATVPGERAWFVVYGIAAFCYRLFIMFAIAMLIATQYFFVGILLAAWATIGMLVVPLGKGIGFLFRHRMLNGYRMRALTTTAVVLLGVFMLIGVIPMVHRTVVQGVVHSPVESQIRASHDGFVRTLVVTDGARVSAGAPLLELDNARLETEVRLLEAQVRELALRKQAAEAMDRVLAASVAQQLDFVRERLVEAERRQDDLVVKAPGTGRVAWLVHQEDLPGRHLKRGDPVAYLLPEEGGVAIRAVVRQDVADLVRQSRGNVEVRFVDAMEVVRTATLVREVPAATFDLPSQALGLQGGGEIATVAEGSRQRAFQSLFAFELMVEDLADPSRLGGRVYVRFDHGHEPLINRWFRAARQLLLSRFNV